MSTLIRVPPLCSSSSLPFSFPFFSFVTNGDPFDEEVRIVRDEDEARDDEGVAVKEECSRKEARADPEDRRLLELILERTREDRGGKR